MRKVLIAIIWLALAAGLIYFALCVRRTCPLRREYAAPQEAEIKPDKDITRAFALLRVRKDREASIIVEAILKDDPDDIDACWAKAELLRRQYDFRASELILDSILETNPGHAPSLLTLAYIRYKEDRLDDAAKLVNRGLRVKVLTNQDKALGLMMLGSINGRRAQQRGLVNMLRFGLRVKSYLLAAAELAPDMPEVHLALGTFYLKAPAIAGGSVEKAIIELEKAILIAPDFATPYVRLAQAYQRAGDDLKYKVYIDKAEELEPENELLLEEKQEKQGTVSVFSRENRNGP